MPASPLCQAAGVGEPADDASDECLSCLGDVAAVSTVLRYFRMPLRSPVSPGPAEPPIFGATIF